MNKNQSAWDTHYTREKSILSIPDENVVRQFQFFLRKHKKENIGIPNNKHNKLNVLDLGCGTGRHINYFKQFNVNGIALDYSFNALKKIQESIVYHKTIQSLATQLPLANSSFDFILAWGVIHYLPQEQLDNFIQEVYRVLKPNGTFLLTLRAKEDSHLKTVIKSGDLKNAESLYFSRKEAVSLFTQFNHIKYGYIMRVPLEQVNDKEMNSIFDEKKVAHHIIEVTK